MLSKKEMKSYYETAAEKDPLRYNRRFRPGIIRHPVLDYFIRSKLDLIKKHYGTKPAKLLDIGCGTGFYFPLLARRAGRITAVDFSRAMAGEAARYAKKERLSNIRVLEMDFESLDLPDESFDVVLSLDVLHHIPDMTAAMKEIRRVLKKGGLFLAIEVNPYNPFALVHNLLRREELGVLKTFPDRVLRICGRFFETPEIGFFQYWPYFATLTPPALLPFIRTMDAFCPKVPVLSRLSVYYSVACRKTG